jgi:methionyl-tRNA synthetase
MFKLSEFHQRIEQWINEKKPLYPMTYNKLALIQLNELKKQGDISISRERKRLSWGIEVNLFEIILLIYLLNIIRYQMIHRKLSMFGLMH